MKKHIEIPAIIKNSVSLSAVFVALLLVIVVGFYRSASWFANNDSVTGSGMSVEVRNDIVGTESFIYKYNYFTRTLEQSATLNMDLYPGEECTVVAIIKRTVDSELNVNLVTGGFSVNYYAIQGLNSDEIGTYLEPYMRAGQYTYMQDGTETEIDPYDADISVENYIRFIKPVTNAIMLYTGILSSADITDLNSFKAFVQQEITVQYGSDATNAFQPGAFETGRVFIESDHCPLDYTTRAEDYYYTLPEQTTPYQLTEISDDNYYAIVCKFVFEDDVFSDADFIVDSIDSSAVTTVTLKNSNPFMYQRLVINEMSFSSTEIEP